MDHPLVVTAAIFALGLIYVLAPIAMDAFVRYRKVHRVVCPEDAVPAQISIDARLAAMSAVAGKMGLRVRQCSLWPEKCGCAQNCVREAFSLR